MANDVHRSHHDQHGQIMDRGTEAGKRVLKRLESVIEPCTKSPGWLLVTQKARPVTDRISEQQRKQIFVLKRH